MSSARLDAWARAEICTLASVGVKPAQIVGKVRKKDGRRPKLRAVTKTIAKKKNIPSWRGTDSSAGGRPRTLSEACLKINAF